MQVLDMEKITSEAGTTNKSWKRINKWQNYW